MEAESKPRQLSAEELDLIFEKYLQRTTDEDERHEPVVGVYHSSDGSKCLRKRHYEDIGVKSIWDPPWGIYERGNKIEDFIEESFEWATRAANEDSELEFLKGAQPGNEISCREEFDDFVVVGSTDPFLEIDDTVIALCEVKSSKSISNGEMTQEDLSFGYLVQINTYLSILGIESGFVVFVQADRFDERTIVEVEQDEALWEFTTTLHHIYHMYRKEGDLPPKTPVHEDECANCNFAPLCMRDEPGYRFAGDNFPPGQPEPHSEKDD